MTGWRLCATLALLLSLHPVPAFAAETTAQSPNQSPTQSQTQPPAQIQAAPLASAAKPSPEKLAIRRSPDTARGVASRAETSSSGTLRVAAALALVIGLIFAAKWAGRRFLGIQLATSSASAIRVLSRTTLSHRQQILAIQVGRRVIVAVNGGARVDTLTEITDPEEVAELVGQLQTRRTESAISAFSSLFGRAVAPYRPLADTPIPRAADELANGDDESAPLERDADQPAIDPALVEDRRREIGGLLDRVRALSRQFGGARPDAGPSAPERTST